MLKSIRGPILLFKGREVADRAGHQHSEGALINSRAIVKLALADDKACE